MPVFSILFLLGFLNALHHNNANLSIYFSEIGFEKDAIGLFCLLAFPFSCKILWSPIIDYVPVPFFAKSPRKGWLMVALWGMALSFYAMSAINPKAHPWIFGAALFGIALFAGCLYMTGIAYELESIPTQEYSTGSACIITGFRTGLLYAGAGMLSIAHLTSWSSAYLTNALLVFGASIAILANKEPYKSNETLLDKKSRLKAHPSFFKGLVSETLIEPCKSFFQLSSWRSVVVVIIMYKACDHMSKPMEGPFYLDLGFNKQDLALAAKTFGFIATVAGAFFAGRILKNKNPFLAVGILSLVHTLTECGCLVHSFVGKSYTLLYLTSGISNFTGGMVVTAFISLLWKFCNKRYAPIQYAFLWSISSLTTNIMACMGGYLAAYCTWQEFFSLTCCIGIACSASLLLVQKPSQSKRNLMALDIH
ncbi:MAG: MFS transporter [Chlamydiales bacterium]|nr:MFS transporter [Chlamydiales bacterium]